jgi:hypothetical protein
VTTQRPVYITLEWQEQGPLETTGRGGRSGWFVPLMIIQRNCLVAILSVRGGGSK